MAANPTYKERVIETRTVSINAYIDPYIRHGWHDDRPLPNENSDPTVDKPAYRQGRYVPYVEREHMNVRTADENDAERPDDNEHSLFFVFAREVLTTENYGRQIRAVRDPNREGDLDILDVLDAVA